MKYAKKVYGNFDTGQNPQAYIGYNIFEKQNYFVVYQKMQGENAILDEQIYISTTEYDDLLSAYYMKVEEQQAADESGN